MSNKFDYNYTNIDIPYNGFMERSDQGIESGSMEMRTEGQPETPSDVDSKIIGGSALDNLWIESWIKSRSYKPKSHGFLIDGRLGYIECMKLFVGTGGIIGGSLDVPNATDSNSWHVDANGNMWSGCNVADFNADNDNANSFILNDGSAKFQNVIIDGGSNVQFISDTLNTTAKTILSDFDFGTTDYAGAVKSGDITWNTSTGAVTGGSGVVVYRSGIVGAAAGVTTFSIDAATGSATFAGTLSAPNGTLGTITSGTIYGATIKQDNTSYPDFVLDTNGLTLHGEKTFYKFTDGTSIATVGATSTKFKITTETNSDIDIIGGGNITIQAPAGKSLTLRSDNADGEIFMGAAGNIEIGAPTGQSLVLESDNGDGKIDMQSNGNIVISTASATPKCEFDCTVRPQTDNAEYFGGSSNRWINIYTYEINVKTLVDFQSNTTGSTTDGAMWYDGDTDEFYVRAGGTTYTLDRTAV